MTLDNGALLIERRQSRKGGYIVLAKWEDEDGYVEYVTWWQATPDSVTLSGDCCSTLEEGIDSLNRRA